jgi:RNA polymerase sigma-70 factor (ECF subfamily)
MNGTTCGVVRSNGDPLNAISGDLRVLVERAKAGRREAVEALYVEHFDQIYAYLAVSVGNRQDAEDLTVQTFVRMIESIDRFEWQSTPFVAWLFRIARNLAIDHFRASKRWQPTDDVPEPYGSESPSAEDQAVSRAGRREALEAIGSLPHAQRQVLTLKFLFSFSNAEAAAILDKTEGAVKALQHRALASLQQRDLLLAA